MLSRIQIMKDIQQPKISPISKDDQVLSNVSVLSFLFFSFLFWYQIWVSSQKINWNCSVLFFNIHIRLLLCYKDFSTHIIS